jgi:hypothetical protein
MSGLIHMGECGAHTTAVSFTASMVMGRSRRADDNMRRACEVTVRAEAFGLKRVNSRLLYPYSIQIQVSDKLGNIFRNAQGKRRKV